MRAEDPDVQLREKVQEVPPSASAVVLHSQDTLSEPVEAPLPGCDSGSGGGTGSTTMSKSDTFQGPEGFRTPSAPGRVTPPPIPKPRGKNNITTSQRDEERREERNHSVNNIKKEKKS